MNDTSEKLVEHMSLSLMQRNWGDIKATTLFDVKCTKSVGNPPQYVHEHILPKCFLYPPYIVGGSAFSRQQKYREQLQKKFEDNELFAQFIAHLYERAIDKGGVRFIFASRPARDTYGDALLEFLMDNAHAIATIHEYLYPEQYAQEASETAS